jgi:DSF synthase
MSTNTIIAQPVHQSYANLEVRVEKAEHAVWVRMQPQGRPCMTPRLLDDLAAAQRVIHSLAETGCSAQDPDRLTYQVLTSATPGVFCLGGDLAHFLTLMERGDRAALYTYAERCVDVLHRSATAYDLPFTTISLVQGQALGGGFEAALSNSVLIAEEGASFGFPETLFGMFPGMGALSLLSRRIAPGLARRIVSSGRLYSARELYDIGVVDVLARDGEGERAVHDYIAERRNRESGFLALERAAALIHPLSYEELVDVVGVWVDTAMALSMRNRRLMGYLVAAQEKRWAGGTPCQVEEEAMPLAALGARG